MNTQKHADPLARVPYFQEKKKTQFITQLPWSYVASTYFTSNNISEMCTIIRGNKVGNKPDLSKVNDLCRQ
jgi:hypothetical protein